MVQVFAENSGTNQIVSALTQPVVFRNQQTSQPFTLNVPITGAGPNFDLFAVAIDPYLGATSTLPRPRYFGARRSPGALGAVRLCPPGRNAATDTTGRAGAHADALMMPAMDCVGHGSITGTVQNPDSGTTSRWKSWIRWQIKKSRSSEPRPDCSLPAIPDGNAQYTLCVPPDNYVLQRFETLPTATPGATMSGTAIATPIPTPTRSAPAQAMMVPQPGATSSPCPSSCSNSDSASGPCPGICTGTSASPL